MNNTDLEVHRNQVQILGTDTQVDLHNSDLEVSPENPKDKPDADRQGTVHFLAEDLEKHRQRGLKH